MKLISGGKVYDVMIIERAAKKFYRKIVNSKKEGCVEWQNAEETMRAV